MSVLPTLNVEVAFDDDALTASPSTWTDITNKVRAGSIRIGRDNELNQTSASVLNLTLDNRVRTFDPFYSSGPYYGKLKTRKQIRVRATYASVTYDLFRGHIAGWPLSPDVSTDMVCQIEAYDILAYLSTFDLPADRLAGWLGSTAVTGNHTSYQHQWAWLPLGTTGQVAYDTWVNASKTTPYSYVFTTPEPRTDSAPSEWLGGSSTQFDGTYGAIGPGIHPGTSGTDFAISFMLKTTTAGPAGGLMPILASAQNAPFTIGIDENGALSTRQGGYLANSGFPVNDGNWHAITVVCAPASLQIYVDGYGLGLAGFSGTWQDIQLIGMRGPDTTDESFFTGSLAHIIITEGWGVTENRTYHELMRYGTKYTWAGGRVTSHENITDLLSDVLTAAKVPTAWTNSSDWSSFDIIFTGGQKWSKPALTAAQEVATSTDGRLDVTGTGIINYRPGGNDFTATRSTTTQMTFSDSGTAGTLNYYDIGAIILSDEFLANRVTVGTSTGVTFEANDTSSQTSYGMRSRQIDTVLESQTDAQTLAALSVTRYSNPIVRIKDWKIRAHGQPTVAYPKVLDARLGDRITLEIIPNGVGTRLSQDMYLEQITHDFTPETWECSFSGSPVRNAWILEDATFGLLESTTILG